MSNFSGIGETGKSKEDVKSHEHCVFPIPDVLQVHETETSV